MKSRVGSPSFADISRHPSQYLAVNSSKVKHKETLRRFVDDFLVAQKDHFSAYCAGS